MLGAACGSTAVESDTAASPTSASIDPEGEAPIDQGEGASTSSGAAETTSTETAPPETTTTAVTAETTTDEPASADQVALIGGGQFDLGSIEGTDTVLWFWAPW